jgi:molybdate transport system substrate-binding protein
MRITVISGGPLEIALVPAAEEFRRASGIDAAVEFETTPMTLKRLPAGEVFDVVVTTPAATDELTRSGLLRGDERVFVGRVGVGVAVHESQPYPDISTVDALKQAVINASSVVFTRASSGLYVEQLMKQLGLTDAIRDKTLRFDNGPSIMAHLIKGKPGEIGIVAQGEILLYRDRGLRLVGPLPDAIQHYTEYVASTMSAARDPQGAREFLRFLQEPKTKALFAARGITV